MRDDPLVSLPTVDRLVTPAQAGKARRPVPSATPRQRTCSFAVATVSGYSISVWSCSTRQIKTGPRLRRSLRDAVGLPSRLECIADSLRPPNCSSRFHLELWLDLCRNRGTSDQQARILSMLQDLHFALNPAILRGHRRHPPSPVGL